MPMSTGKCPNDRLKGSVDDDSTILRNQRKTMRKVSIKSRLLLLGLAFCLLLLICFSIYVSMSLIPADSKKMIDAMATQLVSPPLAEKIPSQNKTRELVVPGGINSPEQAVTGDAPIMGGKREEKKQQQQPEKCKKIEGWTTNWRKQLHGENYDFDDCPWSNVTSVAYAPKQLYAGYRNQIMALTLMVMMTMKDKRSQILHETLTHKDLYGSNRYISFADLFDVKHWNTFYPQLPRMVACDPVIHKDIDCSKLNFFDKNKNNTAPYAFDVKMNHLFAGYTRYARRKGPFATPFPHPADLTILRGALRPNPYLLKIVNDFLKSIGGEESKNSATAVTPKTIDEDDDELPVFMTLHARVEPDKIHDHGNGCGKRQETNLTKVLAFMEKTFPEPPAPRLYLLANLPLLFEAGENVDHKKPESIDWISVDNAKTVRYILKHGLWNGAVNVFAFNSDVLIGTPYEERRSTSGAVLAFHLAKNSNVFIGSEMSSFSVDLVSTRFYSDNRQNYRYRPEGIERWTKDDDEHPPFFEC